jgi:phytanoyl-CoA hydroxylase
MQEKLLNEGYIILRNFFDPTIVKKIRRQAEKIFQLQFDYFGYDESFDSNMFKLFSEHQEIFINCGKLIQTGLIELYELAVDKKLVYELKKLGLSFPNLCTRPVLFFNHPKLAKEEIYYKTPPHQDWPSMLSSSDSLVVWIPLVDVNDKNGSIIVWPKSHLLGVLPYKIVGGFAKVEIDGESIQPELQVGDILIFSTLLVHSSGDIKDNSIRWSCHFRYTNMNDNKFLKMGFPNPYIYKPTIKE